MPDTLTINVAGHPVSLQVRRSNRARRILLRLDHNARRVELVLPVGETLARARRFAESKASWLHDRLARMPAGIPFEPGVSIPVGGVPYKLVHAPTAHGDVVCEHDRLLVSGDLEFFGRRVHDWLKAEALHRISALAYPKAAQVERKIGRISIRDQQSRWGSCSAAGNLNFSWRLVLTPPDVLDYVVSHEVAHLREMNHSPVFWRVVDTLTPHARRGRAWLRANGPSLHSYGAE